MGRATKWSIVIGGYAAAVAAGAVAAWWYDARMAAMPYDTSGGMYAAGESMASLGAFLVVATIPTLFGLWFVRKRAKLWNVVAIAALAFAVIGLAGVVTMLFTRSTPRGGLVVLDLLGLAQLLGVPLWFAAFALFTVLAPTRMARRTLTAAVVIEIVIGACAIVHWTATAAPR